MSERIFSRPRHAVVAKVLDVLNAPFLAHAQCYFGGGTRIVLALDEYRESADIDFLCSSREGYRELRSTVGSDSLGRIVSGKVRLVREVAADRYGIRTFVQIGEQKIKFEIVQEGRIDLAANLISGLGVSCLDESSCFAEKFLANADRWSDQSVMSRDIIDLAFMIEGWGMAPFHEGLALARAAYGDAVSAATRSAAIRLIERKDYLRNCVAGLRVTHAGILRAGLKKLAARRWPAV